MSNNSNHPYHLVENSPWPILASASAFFLTLGLVNWFYTFSLSLFILGLITVVGSASQWWRDVSREASFQGLHTNNVTNGIQWGIILFIISEIIFFFSFFWAFFQSSLTPTIEIGIEWPPCGVTIINPFSVPLLNTAILLASGVTVTWAHHAANENIHTQTTQGLYITVILGVYFTILQAIEYIEASFNISDSAYGSTFFVATGFHGLHVLIGTAFLLVGLARITNSQIASNHHTGFETAIWYWHFVDVVWLFLFTTIYWWGS